PEKTSLLVSRPAFCDRATRSLRLRVTASTHQLARELSLRLKIFLGQLARELSLRLKTFLGAVGQGWREAVISEPALFSKPVRQYFKLYFMQTKASMPKASLYYLHSFHQFPAVYWRCLRHDAKFIYAAHDFYSQLEEKDTLSGYWRRWVLPFEKIMERLCVSRAASIFTVNDSIAQLMKQRFGREPIVIRNAHDCRLDKSVEKNIRDVVGVAA